MSDEIRDFVEKGKARSSEDIPQEWLLLWGVNNLRDAGQLVDVTLVVQGKKLKPCHRVVLSAGSPYFRAMFTHDVIEQHQSEIELKGVDFKSVEIVLEYLYTGNAEVNGENVQDLLTTCSILQVLGLYGKCKRYVTSRLGAQNCAEVYAFAKSLFCAELRDAAFALMTRRFSIVTSTDGFLKLCKDHVIDLLSADELMVESEQVVYEAALAWVAYDIANRGVSIGEIFSYVRLALLDDKFLYECIAKEKALMCHANLCAHVEAALEYKRLVKAQGQLQDAAESQTANNHENETPRGGANEQTDDDETKEAGKAAGDNAAESNLHHGDLTMRFAKFPYFNIEIADAETPVKIPLCIRPRAGMSTASVLVFTNGRKTVVFDPISSRYYCGNQTTETEEGVGDGKTPSDRSGLDPTLPVMKNAEAFASENGSVYLIGGLELKKNGSESKILSKVFVFDIECLSWRQRASLEEPRCMMGLGELAGKFYVTGGKALSQANTLSSVHVYDFDRDEWSRGPDLPMATYGHGCASTRDRLYVIGGKTSEKEILSAVHFLTGDSNQWTSTHALQVPRFLVGASAGPRTKGVGSPESGALLAGRDTRSMIYVVGGVGSDGALPSVELLDIRENSGWKTNVPFPGNRCAQTVSVVNDNLCAVGGHVTQRTGDRFESVQMFDVHMLLPTDPRSPGGAREWRQTTNHVRGIAGALCACAAVRVDPNSIGAKR